ncbi:MAG: IS481 family transposase [Archangium gephyra]|uniref:IS481 family transposase n=2 Tax=Pseudomonadati TaxID=3379134 RepID=A0A2W5SNF6_9BACT|nr:MAG: IS481 family transposase [Archangium gephyra]
MTNIHPQARTTPKVRAEIQKATGTQREIAAQFNVTVATVRKWRSRDPDAVQDRSHRPNRLSTTLSPAQEGIVIELRRTLLLPLDDLLVVTREFIHAGASRAALDRLLRRHGVSRLGDLQVQAGEAPTRASKTFKSYEPSFVHIDIKYLPQMPDEAQRRYLFVAIDRATRWVFVHVYADQTEASSCDFLWRLHQAAPMRIAKVLTDNGSQFTDRFTTKRKTPSGAHAFDKRCAGLGIEHRLASPRRPQTNGMVERFNGRITEVIAQTRFKSAAELDATLTQYVQTYNSRIPQRARGHRSPLQAMQAWRSPHPNLFTKRLNDRPGLDT